MKLPRLFLQIKYACQTHGLAKDVSLARTFLLAVAKANSKRNFAKSGKITFILFYLHFILFLKTSTEFGSPLSARFLKGFSAYEALLFAHLTLNCMSGKEHLCIFGSSDETSPHTNCVLQDIEIICKMYGCTMNVCYCKQTQRYTMNSNNFICRLNFYFNLL